MTAPTPSQRQPDVAGVVIPTYCESGTLPGLLEALFALPEAALLHVLVVDDQSPDGTAARVRELQSRYPRLHLCVREHARGRGSAVVHGFLLLLGEESAGASLPRPDVVVEMDADLSHSPAELPGLLAALRDADVVIGSRYVPGGGADLAPARQLLSTLANLFSRRVLGLPYLDCSTGYRCYRAAALRSAGLRTLATDGHATHIELLYRLHRLGARIVEAPIFYRPRRAGTTKAGLLEIGRVLRALLLMRAGGLGGRQPGRPPV